MSQLVQPKLVTGFAKALRQQISPNALALDSRGKLTVITFNEAP